MCMGGPGAQLLITDYFARAASVTSDVVAVPAAARDGAQRLVDAAALAVRGGNVRSTMPLPGLDRRFVLLDLRCLLTIANAPALRGSADFLLQPPTEKAVRATLAATITNFVTMTKEGQAAAVRAAHRDHRGRLALAISERLYRPGCAPRLPRGSQLVQLNSDGITGMCPQRALVISLHLYVLMTIRGSGIHAHVGRSPLPDGSF